MLALLTLSLAFTQLMPKHLISNKYFRLHSNNKTLCVVKYSMGLAGYRSLSILFYLMGKDQCIFHMI